MRTLLASLSLVLVPAACYAQSEQETGGATPTTPAPLTLEQEITQLKQQIEDLRESVANLQSQLGSGMAAVGGAAETSIVGAMAKDPEVQLQVGHAVQGRLNILNYTGAPTEITINGSRWTALRGRSYVLVPVGQVAVYRPGDQSAQVLPNNGDTWRRRRDTNQLELTYELY